MSRPKGVTPKRYVATIRRLVQSGQHEVAEAFAAAHSAEMMPQLSPAQRWEISDLMHIATNAADMTQLVQARHAGKVAS